MNIFICVHDTVRILTTFDHTCCQISTTDIYVHAFIIWIDLFLRDFISIFHDDMLQKFNHTNMRIRNTFIINRIIDTICLSIKIHTQITDIRLNKGWMFELFGSSHSYGWTCTFVSHIDWYGERAYHLRPICDMLPRTHEFLMLSNSNTCFPSDIPFIVCSINKDVFVCNRARYYTTLSLNTRHLTYNIW